MSTSISALIADLFSGRDVEAATRLLPRQGEGQTDWQYERMVAQVLALSEGSLRRLKYFAERAADFPGDIRVLTKMAETEHGFPKTALLMGGEIEISERGPRRRAFPTDIWGRATRIVPYVCVVCLESIEESAVAIVYVSSITSAGGSPHRREMIAMVHRTCMDLGRSQAHAEGCGWKEGPAEWPPSRMG